VVEVKATVVMRTKEVLDSRALQCVSSMKASTSIPFNLFIVETKNMTHPMEINRIAEIADTPFLVTVDDDVVVEEGWLEAMLETLQHDDIGQTQLWLVNPEGKSIWNVQLQSREPNDMEDISYACTACMAVKLDVFKKVGGCDTSYRKYAFDVDLSWKIKELGYRVVLTKRSRGIHFIGYWAERDKERYLKLGERDHQLLYDKWFRTGRVRREWII